MKSNNQIEQARPYAFKFLFQLGLVNTNQAKTTLDNIDEYLTDFEESYFEEDDEHPDNKITPKEKLLAIKLIKGVLTHFDELNNTIKDHLHKWKMEDLEKVDIILLRIGSFELLQLQEMPFKVTISEIVRLAQRYGNKSSYSFINGVLDKIAKERN
jgi:transcription antitermination protein NusB